MCTDWVLEKKGGGGGRGEAKQLTLSDWSSKCIPLPHLHCFNTRPSNSESFSKSSPWHWNKNESISATMHSAIANYNFFLQLTKFFPIFVTRNLWNANFRSLKWGEGGMLQPGKYGTRFTAVVFLRNGGNICHLFITTITIIRKRKTNSALLRVLTDCITREILCIM